MVSHAFLSNKSRIRDMKWAYKRFMVSLNLCQSLTILRTDHPQRHEIHSGKLSFVFQNRIFLLIVTLFTLTTLLAPVHSRLPFRFRFRDLPTKRSYVSLQCRGLYDANIFSKLDGICEDCYNLYREPEVHGMCR